MRRRKFWLTILLLSSMASMQILAQGLTPPSGKAPLPASPQDSPLYTEAQVIQALRVGIQVALDKAVPLAVQAAVAEKEGQRATAQSLADQWKAQALDEHRKKTDALIEGFCVGGVTGLAISVVAYLILK